MSEWMKEVSKWMKECSKWMKEGVRVGGVRCQSG